MSQYAQAVVHCPKAIILSQFFSFHMSVILLVFRGTGDVFREG